MRVLAFSALFLLGEAPSLAACLPALETLQARTAVARSCQDLSEEAARKSCLLGERLFHSPALSFDQKASCSSCHRAEKLYGDGLAQAELRNISLVGSRTLNLSDISRRPPPYFWNGRASSLRGAVFWPLYNRQEMGATHSLLEKHGGDEKVVAALEAYIRTRNTGEAAIDRFLQGDCSALNARAQKGLTLALNSGCVRCHQGSEWDQGKLVNYRYSKLPKAFFQRAEARYGQNWQLHQDPQQSLTLKVKVPSLRNLEARQGPWGQFGQTESLEDYLILHSKQLGIPTWKTADRSDLLYFLEHALSSDDSSQLSAAPPFSPEKTAKEQL